MRNIVVLTSSFLFEYSNAIISGISNYFSNKNDVRVIIAQTRTPESNEWEYEYQFWNITELLKADDIDAFIVLSGSFFISLKEQIKKINIHNKPVISISQDIGIEGSSYTICKPEDSYTKVISHLKNKHGCKRIAYFSGRNARTEEAENRYKAYFTALKANGLPVDESIVFDGSFTQNSTVKIFEKYFPTKESVNFDAVLCGNDSMGVATIACLRKLGIKVPEEVKVIGFDNSILTKVTKPTLSSIDQQMELQGMKAAELAYEALQGKKIPEETTIGLNPVYRQSCGCVLLNESSMKSINEDGNVLIDEDETLLLQRYNEMNKDNNSISCLFNSINAKTTVEQYSKNLKKLKSNTSFDSITVCLFDEPVKAFLGENFQKPDCCTVKMDINDNNEVYFNEYEIPYDLNKTLIPYDYLKDRNGNFIIYPVISGEDFYGYILCKYNSNKFSFHELCLKLISHTIARSVVYTESLKENVNLVIDKSILEVQNIDLQHESRFDALTQVYNRRGFMEEGQKLIDKTLRRKGSGIVFFGDLDGLKKINDNYGHESGDLAIKTESEILRNAFSSNDIVGRLSGDEFAVVSPDSSMEQAEAVQNHVNEIAKTISNERKFKFPLSISIGYIQFDENNSNLSELLILADKGLYKQKHLKHGEDYFKR